MNKSLKTIFYDRHLSLGATMVDFAGWLMPMQYKTGIIEEHLLTRKKAGLFDVSHMGRFVITGNDSLLFLQKVLSNNAASLNIPQAQYTIIQNENGGAIDDAYLYLIEPNKYILVVNASNIKKDWDYLNSFKREFKDLNIEDKTEEIAMLSLQGPTSKFILDKLIEGGRLPEPLKNSISIINIKGKKIIVARTGYTGEPIGFEFFIDKKDALMIWDILIENGAIPIGLGARNTLRLEAGLPLYGNEIKEDIPIFACPLSRFAVSFSPLKGEFIGKNSLLKQFNAFKKIINRNYSLINDLPRIIMPVVVLGKGVARDGFKVFKDGKLVGIITSGTMVPYWKTKGSGLEISLTDEREMRAICLALLNSNLKENDKIYIDIRGKEVEGVIVPFHLKSDTPPFARPIIYGITIKKENLPNISYKEKVKDLLNKTIENTIWRQKECINLIPSEQTISPMARLLSIMDPTFRYAEHKRVKSFYDAEVFYYQGTKFIERVETLLIEEMKNYLNCSEVEVRAISGQMANMILYSAYLDYLNRGDIKNEPRKIRYVLNHHIIKGGHLSAQTIGGIKNFVSIDPRTEKPAVVNFPVCLDNPFKVDVEETKKIISEYKPELIIFGKSLILHREPVKEIREFLNTIDLECIIMYDMAHVLGLVGQYFQEPFKEGADIVTGSTHKTFFGTQRGIIASNYKEEDKYYPLWNCILNRTFPGSLSNHHLGTLLGLLVSTYEMNYFKDEYQKKVISNAKSFAKALKNCGLHVVGDPSISYTETHQVVIKVGYGKGIELARKLEENNIITNYQATADEEGFTASGAIRMGVSELTRFGMEEEDFKVVAQFIHDVINNNKNVKEEVKKFRKKFLDLKFCFKEKEFEPLIQKLHSLI
jgi:aminomethyltransferase